MRNLSKNEEIVKYIVERLSGKVGRVRLMKYLYLADLEARRYLGRPLSTFRYRLDKFGPFDPAIYRVLESLTREGLIAQDQYPWQGSVGFVYHDSREPVIFSLSPAERHILEYVMGRFHTVEMDRLLEDIVYETSPVKGAKVGRVLNMDKVNNEMSRKLKGIDLERILHAEQQLQEGKYTTLDQILKEFESARPGGRAATPS
jgi:hypothetical protein